MISIKDIDIINTYPEKWIERTFQYKDVISIRERTGWSKYKIEKETEIDIGRIKHWIYDKTEPIPIKTVRELEKRNLLPFDENNGKFGIILDCFAFIFSDGNLNYNTVRFTGQREDLELMGRRIKNLGFEGKIVTKKLSNYHILGERTLNGTTHDLIINSSSLARLLISLGAPVGDKTKNPVYFPEWLKKSNKNVKRRFISVLYGCEGKIPKSYKGRLLLGIKMSKNIKYKNEHENFMNDIKNMISEFGIKTSNLVWEGKINYRKDGIKTQACNFTIGDYVNILKFLNEFDILYSKTKRDNANKLRKYVEERLRRLTENHKKYDKFSSMKDTHNLTEIANELMINRETVRYWYSGKPALYEKSSLIRELTK
jgi:intein/homing endonuclease